MKKRAYEELDGVPLNEELEALDYLIDILTTLDDGAQHRVLRYLADRFDVII